MKRTRALFPLAQNTQQTWRHKIMFLVFHYRIQVSSLVCLASTTVIPVERESRPPFPPFCFKAHEAIQSHNPTVSPFAQYQYSHPLNPLVIQASCHIARHISTFSLILIWDSANSVSDGILKTSMM